MLSLLWDSIILMRSLPDRFIPEKFAILCCFGLPQCIARDLGYPDRHDNRSRETDAKERPVLPAMLCTFAARSGDNSGFAGHTDVNVEKRARDHPDPAREHIRPELHTSETVKVIADIKRDSRTKSQQKNQLRALFADRIVDLAKLF